MKKRMLLTSLVAAVGALSLMVSLPVRQANAQAVFQAAGPDAASIKGTVDAYRAALGDPNNGNNAGPLTSGRREINWDGGGGNFTTSPFPPETPFNVFLNSRGAQFTTPGTGLTQAPPVADPVLFPPGGLAGLFDNPTYGSSIFSTFSQERLFTPVGSRVTEGFFFVPDPAGATIRATVTGFGAVFTDVDKPNGTKQGQSSTLIAYFDADGRLLFEGRVPSSPGDGGLSFFGIVFDDPRIARVKITTGDSKPGPDDLAGGKDIVMMDDFIYGEPQPLP